MKILPEKAYCITVDGGISEIMPGNGSNFRLEEAQQYVGGYIEVVRLTDSQIMIVNEEGKYMYLLNPIATAIAEIHHAISKHDYIAGDVIVCPSEMLQ